jgi:hypothetical protein
VGTQASKRALSRAIADGAAGGLTGTAVMTGVQLGWRRLGDRSELAPQTITDAALYAAGVEAPSAVARRVAAACAHASFGAIAGAAFGGGLWCLGSAAPSRLTSRLVTGGAFGVAVWAANYATWVPAIGVLPSPAEDDARRQWRLVVGHVVFGCVTSLVGASRAP